MWIGTSVLTNSICAFSPQLPVNVDSAVRSLQFISFCDGQDAILWPPPNENRSVVLVVLATWGSASTCDCAANVTAAMHRRQTILRSNVHCPSAVISPCLDADTSILSLHGRSCLKLCQVIRKDSFSQKKCGLILQP